MLALVLGEAASGKSEFAEKLAMYYAEERYYIATMQAADTESERRIDRHRQMRSGKGFVTLERSLDLAGLGVPAAEGTAALLECASTLLGNELYLPDGAAAQGQPAEQVILAGVQNLLRQGLQVVVVSNCVFADGAAYSPEMREYLNRLGRLNFQLAAMADVVVEVCCGLPLYHKGDKIMDF